MFTLCVCIETCGWGLSMMVCWVHMPILIMDLFSLCIGLELSLSARKKEPICNPNSNDDCFVEEDESG